jgi:hypothetical protein
MPNYFPIVERDDGRFQIGFADDAPGPFESREFALRVATGHPLASAPIPKCRHIKIREARVASA